MKWRRRQEEVEAILFTEDNLDDTKEFLKPYSLKKTKNHIYWIFSPDGLPYSPLMKSWVVVKRPNGFSCLDKRYFLSQFERVQ